MRQEKLRPVRRVKLKKKRQPENQPERVAEYLAEPVCAFIAPHMIQNILSQPIFNKQKITPPDADPTPSTSIRGWGQRPVVGIGMDLSRDINKAGSCMGRVL